MPLVSSPRVEYRPLLRGRRATKSMPSESIADATRLIAFEQRYGIRISAMTAG